jgi:hypothetical protein
MEWEKLGDKCLAILGIEERDAKVRLDDARNLMKWLKS